MNDAYFKGIQWTRNFVSGPVEPIHNKFKFNCMLCKVWSLLKNWDITRLKSIFERIKSGDTSTCRKLMTWLASPLIQYSKREEQLCPNADWTGKGKTLLHWRPSSWDRRLNPLLRWLYGQHRMSYQSWWPADQYPDLHNWHLHTKGWHYFFTAELVDQSWSIHQPSSFIFVIRLGISHSRSKYSFNLWQS